MDLRDEKTRKQLIFNALRPQLQQIGRLDMLHLMNSREKHDSQFRNPMIPWTAGQA